jgi:hypothetical protein
VDANAEVEGFRLFGAQGEVVREEVSWLSSIDAKSEVNPVKSRANAVHQVPKCGEGNANGHVLAGLLGNGPSTVNLLLSSCSIELSDGVITQPLRHLFHAMFTAFYQNSSKNVFYSSYTNRRVTPISDSNSPDL